MARWSVEQVLKLAPDDSAAKAARGLTSPRTWSQMGGSETLVWGKCQGSGKEPYQVTVDLTAPSFKCTCPSRKFPCKHGLALLLMWASNDGSVADVSEENVADFAADWATDRATKKEQREERRAARADADGPADPEAQAKRLAERIAKMDAGIDELDRWLGDLVREGIAGVKSKPFAFWDTMAARLVDAQIPGLGDRLRTLGGEVIRRDDWVDHLLGALGRIYAAVEGWRRRDVLREEVAADLRTFLGWPRSLDEVRDTPSTVDRWFVLGVRQGGDERLRNQRTWLRGESSGETVVLLDFAAAGGALRVAHVVGVWIEAPVACFPGAGPRRALLAGDGTVSPPSRELPRAVGNEATIEAALESIAHMYAANPWADRVPIVLDRVRIVEHRSSWIALDGSGAALPLAFEDEEARLRALARCGPCRTGVFGEWEDGRLWPATLATEDGLVSV